LLRSSVPPRHIQAFEMQDSHKSIAAQLNDDYVRALQEPRTSEEFVMVLRVIA